jgi:HD superfamily phosphodiesterase
VQSKDHEEISAQIAREILPKYQYTPEQIETICSIIKATKLPPNPKTLLEKIICDADLDYLGRKDFIPVSNNLYRELREQNLVGDINEWNRMQIKFLTNHQYFTQTANNLREVNKQTQIERLKQETQDE